MPVSHDIAEQLQKIDAQLVDLLAERVNFCRKALEEDEEAFWDEEADGRGLNIGVMNQICKLVLKLCKAGEE
jgi:hypothetical protein